MVSGLISHSTYLMDYMSFGGRMNQENQHSSPLFIVFYTGFLLETAHDYVMSRMRVVGMGGGLCSNMKILARVILNGLMGANPQVN